MLKIYKAYCFLKTLFKNVLLSLWGSQQDLVAVCDALDSPSFF